MEMTKAIETDEHGAHEQLAREWLSRVALALNATVAGLGQFSGEHDGDGDRNGNDGNGSEGGKERDGAEEAAARNRKEMAANAWALAKQLVEQAPVLPEGWAAGLNAQRDQDGPDGWASPEWEMFNRALGGVRREDDTFALEWETLALAHQPAARLIAECAWGWGLDEDEGGAGWRLEAKAAQNELSDAVASNTFRLAALKTAFVWREGAPWALLPQEKGRWMTPKLRREALERWSPDSASGCDLTTEWTWADQGDKEADAREYLRVGRACLGEMADAGIVDPRGFPGEIERMLASEIVGSQIGIGCQCLFERMPQDVAQDAPWGRWADLLAERASRSKYPAGWGAAIAFAQARCLRDTVQDALRGAAETETETKAKAEVEAGKRPEPQDKAPAAARAAAARL